jgi:hypothetical protein
MGDGEPMAAVARATDPDFVLVPIASHYDGVYFYTVGRDPLARGDEHKLIDLGGYRYEHPGFGWLGWLLSAGQPSALPLALLLAALVCAAAAGGAASLLAADLGLSPWWGLVVALNPGLVYSITVVTSEAAGLAALLVSLYAWRRGRRLVAVIALTAACLIKEPFLLLPVGIAIYELVRWLRGRPAGGVSAGSFLRRLARSWPGRWSSSPGTATSGGSSSSRRPSSPRTSRACRSPAGSHFRPRSLVRRR